MERNSTLSSVAISWQSLRVIGCFESGQLRFNSNMSENWDDDYQIRFIYLNSAPITFYLSIKVEGIA